MKSHEYPTNDKIERVVDQHGDMIFKICLIMLRNESDAEDALQETILKYINKSPEFQSSEHEKAWLIRVAKNVCKDVYKSRAYREALNIEDFCDYYKTEENGEMIRLVMELPPNYRIVICLHYISGYKTDEIASILKIRPATVRKRLQYGRKLLIMEYQEG